MTDMIQLAEFTAALVRVSEKSANIARRMRSEHALFQLLVEEKTGDSKNKRFIEDFKTLGDVLVQETVRHDLEEQFPGIAGNIKGEESNKFTNTLGETVVVEVKANKAETAKLLCSVLDGNEEAANLLADEVHHDVAMATEPALGGVDLQIPLEDVGVWIDPIDSTAQYIHGYESVQADNGVYTEGLQCVVVLIGAYHIPTGLPIIGAMNQPFAEKNTQSGRWSGRAIWGMSFGACNVSSPSCPQSQQAGTGDKMTAIVMSTSENQQLQQNFKEHYRVCYAAGAGYKIQCVIDGLTDLYVLSQPSTFKWDACAPHAVLRAMGGGLVSYDLALRHVRENGSELTEEDIGHLQLQYSVPDSSDLAAGQTWSNSGGLIAYRTTAALKKVLSGLV